MSTMPAACILLSSTGTQSKTATGEGTHIKLSCTLLSRLARGGCVTPVAVQRQHQCTCRHCLTDVLPSVRLCHQVGEEKARQASSRSGSTSSSAAGEDTPTFRKGAYFIGKVCAAPGMLTECMSGTRCCCVKHTFILAWHGCPLSRNCSLYGQLL